MNQPRQQVKVVKNGRTFDVIVDGQLVEGGFFSRDAAERAAEEAREEESSR